MTTTTTIKVTAEVRDRLRAQARAADVTLGEHLARLADAADRGLRFEALRAAVTAAPADAGTEVETAAWLDADLGTGD